LKGDDDDDAGDDGYGRHWSYRVFSTLYTEPDVPRHDLRHLSLLRHARETVVAIAQGAKDEIVEAYQKCLISYPGCLSAGEGDPQCIEQSWRSA
jgi:hypothetical protein